MSSSRSSETAEGLVESLANKVYVIPREILMMVIDGDFGVNQGLGFRVAHLCKLTSSCQFLALALHYRYKRRGMVNKGRSIFLSHDTFMSPNQL